MRDAGAVQVLQAFVSTQTSADSADMVKRANLALEQFATAAAAATTSAPVSVAVTSSHMVCAFYRFVVQKEKRTEIILKGGADPGTGD